MGRYLGSKALLQGLACYLKFFKKIEKEVGGDLGPLCSRKAIKLIFCGYTLLAGCYIHVNESLTRKWEN